jgi:hypothetical protein
MLPVYFSLPYANKNQLLLTGEKLFKNAIHNLCQGNATSSIFLQK